MAENDYLTREECLRVVDKALRAAHASPTTMKTVPFKVATLFDMIEEDIEERGGRTKCDETPACIAFDTGNGRHDILYKLQNADHRPPMIHRQHLSIFAPSLEIMPQSPIAPAPRPARSSVHAPTKLDPQWVSGRKLLSLLKEHVPNTSAKPSRHELLLRMTVRKMYDQLEEPEGIISFKDRAGETKTIRCHQFESREGKLSVAIHQNDLNNMYDYAAQQYTQRNSLYLDPTPAARQR